MSDLKNLLVTLDLSDMDDIMLDYLRYFIDFIIPDKIYFLHVVEDLEAQEPGAQGKPGDEVLLSKMKKLADEYLAHRTDIQLDFNVIEGSVFESIIHWSKVKDVDLVVMGKKRVGSGSGLVSRKIAREVPCSVLFIPEDVKPKMSKILVPMDFSLHSEYSLTGALEIRKRSDSTDVICLNVYDMPVAEHRTIHTHKQHMEYMRQNAEEASKNFVEKYPHDSRSFSFDFVANERGDVAKHINTYSLEHESDLIIIGAKGHSKLERLMLGSVTEKLLVLNDSSAILVMKNPRVDTTT